LIGVYDSQVAFGQSRVLLVWTRLIMPNGRSIVLERQPGADTAGNPAPKSRLMGMINHARLTASSRLGSKCFVSLQPLALTAMLMTAGDYPAAQIRKPTRELLTFHI
jgi:type IV secretory pathway VirB10-like protein